MERVGTSADAGSMHYILFGHAEGRSVTIDPFEYIASNPDLIPIFRTDTIGATGQYIAYGFHEGRSTTAFDAQQYLANYPDLQRVFRNDLHLAVQHYINHGYQKGRTDHPFG
jgi:hypothetical protein